jgi:hypothetical protein
VCVQELLGNVGEERKDERQREGKKLRERNREKWREIERRRECNGIAARRNSGAGTTEEGTLVCWPRRRNCARYATSFSLFYIRHRSHGDVGGW